MIIRNDRHPRGIDVGPVSRMTPVSELRYLAGGMGSSDTGLTYRQRGELIAAGARRIREAKVEPPKAEPILLHVECQVCPTVFETHNARRVFCSERCQYRRYRQLHPRPSRAKARTEEPVKVANCGHPDRPPVALGKCRPCYNRDWKRARRAA